MRSRQWGVYGVAVVVVVALLTRWMWFSEPIPPRVTTRLLMGTLVSISTWGIPEQQEARAVGLAFEEMARIEAMMSRFQPESVVARLNSGKRGEDYPIPKELGQLLLGGLQINARSQGAFAMGLAPLADLWGFSREPYPVAPPDANAVAAWLKRYAQAVAGGIIVTTTPEFMVRLQDETIGLDLGGIAKGYGVDRAVEILHREGVDNVLINAGGDMRGMGSKGGVLWHIGLKDPREPTGVVAVIDWVGGMAMSTSGDYERFFMFEGRRYHHILDPKTGDSARSGLISVSVQARDSLTADGLSTALFVLGEEAGLRLLRQFPGCEALLIRQDGGFVQTPGFVGRWVQGP